MSDTKLNTLEQPEVMAFFDAQTNTISYIVKDPSSTACAVIDSVMNMDYAAGRITFESADEIVKTIKDQGLELQWIIETHVHADHLSAAPYLQEQLGGKIGISEKIIQVQDTFGKIFNEGTAFQRDGSQFDALFEDGDSYHVGQMQATVIATPGHTPACMSHLIGDALFVGDTLFMPDAGTARADFPGGDASTLFRSIHRLLELPGETRVFMCHDYGPNDRELEYQTTIAEERERNIHVNESISEEQFVKMREARDATLAMPHLILPSLQVNVRAGEMPEAEDNGMVYLKVPINAFK